MNQRNDIINTLSYHLIKDHFLLPARTKELTPVLTDDQNILERSTSSEYFVVKLLDGDSINVQNLLNDINMMTDLILKNRASRSRPVICSYFIVITNTNYSEYKNILNNNLDNLIRSDIGISVTLLNIDTHENYTMNSTRKSQKNTIGKVLSDFEKCFSPEYKPYSLQDILNHLDSISSKTQKFGKIRGFSVTKCLVIINALIWLFGLITEFSNGTDILFDFGYQQGSRIINEYEYWRLLTSIFLHADFLHMAFNSYFLYYCGEMVESLYGKNKFIFIYLLTGFAGNILSLFLLSPNDISIGASGACLGLGGILVYQWIRRKNNFLKYFQNMSSLIVMILFNVFYGFFLPDANINNWAHLGGFICGAFIGFILDLRIFLPKDH